MRLWSTTVAIVTLISLDRPQAIAQRPGQPVALGGRIVALGPKKSVKVPKGALVIDGQGRFVMPGLTDTHVHLEGSPEGWMLPLFVVYGVTTVFNLKGSPEILALRARVRTGEVLGPAIYSSGPYTNERRIKTPHEARAEVAAQKGAGYDFVKIHGNLTAETHAAMTEAGRAQGIPVIGHAPRNLPFESVLTTRQALVAHGEELIYTHFRTRDTTGLVAMARRMVEAGVWLTPNLSMFHGIMIQWGRADGADSSLALPERGFLSPRGIQFWTKESPYTGRDPAGAAQIERNYRFLVLMTGVFAREGVKLLAGTDTPLPIMFPGHSLHDDIDEFRAAGLSPFEALATATRNPGQFLAQFVDSTYRGGVVSVGARADLILLSANPLEDVRAARRPEGVMIGGRWLDQSARGAIRDSVLTANRTP